jgi:hypothetical protein
MKKLFLSAILSVLIAGSLCAADVNKENVATVADFSVDFTNAENVHWTSTKNYLKASFTLNNKKMEAYYEHDGSMIGTASAININELPVSAKRIFAKKYGSFTVKEAILFEATSDTAYYVSAEDEVQSLIITISSEGIASVFKKVKK